MIAYIGVINRGDSYGVGRGVCDKIDSFVVDELCEGFESEVGVRLVSIKTSMMK